MKGNGCEKVGPGLIGKDPECQAVHGDWFLVDKEGGIQECPAEQYSGKSLRAGCGLAQGCLGFRWDIWLGCCYTA